MVHINQKMTETKMYKQKFADDAMRINLHKIDVAEKVVSQHAFKNVNRRCLFIIGGRLLHNLGTKS